MKENIELLSPGGDIESIKAAILAGADAVYCGLNKFNARNRAANISFDDLPGIIKLAHENHCKVFLTLNILILDCEIPDLVSVLNRLVNTAIDGVIVQDIGLLYLLSKYFGTLEIHASTQLTTHNRGQLLFLKELNVKRVNLSRELNIHEIKSLTQFARKVDVDTEVFVHGSYCIAFSGNCYMSSVHGGNSGNRGRCSQPCRDKYVKTEAGWEYPLNLKDNSAYYNLPELIDAGVKALKIEGRIKEFEYVYTVTNVYKNQILNIYNQNSRYEDNNELYKVFNRDFSNGFLSGQISKEMFIENPMSYSTQYHSDNNNYNSDEEKNKGKADLYDEKERTRNYIKNRIKKFSLEKIPLKLIISGQAGFPLNVKIITHELSFDINSEVSLSGSGNKELDSEIVLSRFQTINDTAYKITDVSYELGPGLFLPFTELTALKRRILFRLNGSREYASPVSIPGLDRNIEKTTPRLGVLISETKDIELCTYESADFYFQLPSSFGNELNRYLKLFRENSELIPWFPSIILGSDFDIAVEFLRHLQPTQIVTNNSGIAFEACKMGISWIAGPMFNITNSYSLLCLKEIFNCKGSFLSNEMSKGQMMAIRKPEDFRLFYEIYHPIELMTSRQCLFHQVTGCEKHILDENCIEMCEKSASITSLKNVTSLIKKTKGNYHKVFNACNYLNTEIVDDFPHLFSGFLVDLRRIDTETKVVPERAVLISQFRNLTERKANAKEQLEASIFPTIKTQYKKGI